MKEAIDGTRNTSFVRMNVRGRIVQLSGAHWAPVPVSKKSGLADLKFKRLGIKLSTPKVFQVN